MAREFYAPSDSGMIHCIGINYQQQNIGRLHIWSFVAAIQGCAHTQLFGLGISQYPQSPRRLSSRVMKRAARAVVLPLLVAALARLFVTEVSADPSVTVDVRLGDALRAAIASIRVQSKPGTTAEPAAVARRNAVGNQAQALGAFYARRDFVPLWIRSGQPTAQALSALQVLCDADEYGLVPEDYGCDMLTRMVQSLRQREELLADGRGSNARKISSLLNGSDASRAPCADWTCFELQLSGALFAFLGDVHAGRIDPHQAGFELAARPTLDRAAVLTQLAGSSDPGSVVSTVEPQYIHYRLLKQALQRYRMLARQAGLTALPPLPKPRLTLGDRYEGTPALRRLLNAIGCMDRVDAPDPLRIDAAVVEALKQFQGQHALLVDGVLGSRTYRALTVPLSQRVREIELTLERWRWLPPLQYPTVLVNIPQFRLFAFNSPQDREQGMLRMDVIVGGEYGGKQTPVFSADMTAIVFRPYWDVPRSIVLREILPEVAHNPHYLQAQHLELVRGETDASPVVPATPENLRALAQGHLRLRQRPGLDNALGLVKFLLPNTHDVYLHDTPAIQLFQRAQRTFSHGCIRVSDPVALAHYALANNDGDWTDAKIVSLMHASNTLRVPLARSVHVMILYGTAVASEDGQVRFFDDIYRQDRRLEVLLGLPLLSSDRTVLPSLP